METSFFEKAALLDGLKRVKQPSTDEIGALLVLIRNDETLACYFYEENEYGKAPEAGWVRVLREAGQFGGLDEVGEGKEVSNVDWLMAKYLSRAAGEAPEEVFSVISTVEPKNELVQSFLIEAIGNMPDEWAERGYPVIKGWIGTKKPFVWYWAGEASAKLMCRLLDVNMDVAFKIAGLLLEVWYEKGSKERTLSLTKMRARFEEREYAELVLKYYEEFWKRHPYRAGMMLVNTFAKGLDEVNEGEDGEASERLYGVENIENLGEPTDVERNYEAIIVEGICRAGKEIIEKEEEKVEEFLQNLRSRQRAIFNRIEMYLLRFVTSKKYEGRVNEIIGNREYFDRGKFKYEYNLLLKEKADVLSEEVKERYVEWINGLKVEDLDNFRDWFLKTRKREYSKEELEQYESGNKARKLYLVRDVFPKLYEEHKKKSGWTDADLMPLPMVGEVRVISESESEGSPKTKEEMLEMSVGDVLEFVRDPENYKEPEDGGYRAHSVASALAYTLQQVISERTVDYVRAEPDDVLKLGGDFVTRYFNGIWDGLREKKLEGFPWDKFLTLAKRVIAEYRDDSEGRSIFPAVIWCIQRSFGDGPNSLKYTEGDIDSVYEIVSSLLELKEEKDESYTDDPVQIRCNSFTGEAVMTSLSLGIVCKRDYSEKYTRDFREKVRRVFDRVLDDIRTSWTVCTFGSDLARFYWLDPEWVEERIEDILCDDLWDVVWKTYLIWGRPSEKVFAFLAARGIYGKAIGRIGIGAEKKGRKDADEALATHMVIAYFNGWLAPGDQRIMEQFIEKASDGLRGHATRFFTTGFKSLKEEGETNRETVERLRAYWESRLEAMSERPKEHLQEGMAFACWAVDTPFEAKETLELASRTLEITGGKFDRNRDIYSLINSVCDLAEGYEVQAIECIREVIRNESVAIHFTFYEKKLTALLTRIVAEEVRKEAVHASISLINDLGRVHVYKYRDMLGGLAGKLRNDG